MKIIRSLQTSKKYTKDSVLIIGNLDGVHKGHQTIIKSAKKIVLDLFNLILSQQLGVGFYEEAKIKPFMHIHCYLNIPDTSCRDSLFQAEARRCKEIIDALDENKDDSHFCIFDELYQFDLEKLCNLLFQYLSYIFRLPSALLTL